MASDIRLLHGIGEIADAYDGFILDVWGVLHDGLKPFPGVLDALTRFRRNGKRAVVLSNAPRRAVPVGNRLTEIGIPPALYDHIHTSGEETWQHLKRRDDSFYAGLGRRCYLIAPSRDNGVIEGLDLERVETVADAEFIFNTGPWGWDEDVVRYEEMLTSARARNLPMVCANPDLVVHHQGCSAVGAGAIAQRYEALGGTVRWHGKPFAAVYETVLSLLGITDRKRILAIGDSLRTDIAGANGAGIDSVLVAGGIHYADFGAAPGALPNADGLGKAIAAAGIAPKAAMAELRW
jgi:HAD superfamily hydrolase (TIGR01459 family)